MRSITTTSVQIPSKASANNLQAGKRDNANVLSLPAVSVHPLLTANDNHKTIQMVSPITTHPGLNRSTLAGGGRNSNVSTGREVNDIARQGNQQEIRTAIGVLRTSVAARNNIITIHFGTPALQNSPDGQHHAARIQNEQQWIQDLDNALQTRFQPIVPTTVAPRTAANSSFGAPQFTITASK